MRCGIRLVACQTRRVSRLKWLLKLQRSNQQVASAGVGLLEDSRLIFYARIRVRRRAKGSNREYAGRGVLVSQESQPPVAQLRTAF